MGHKASSAKTASPIREAFTEWRTIARLVGLGAVGAVGFYMSFVYVTTYLRQIDHTAQSTALDINTISMAVLLLLLAPVGALSDRCGRKPILLIATCGMFLMAWPLFWMLRHHAPLVILLGQIGFAVLSACFWGTIPATMVELVPERVRCTVLSLGYVFKTGKPFAVRGVSVIDIADGRISRNLDYYDAAAIMRQVGVLPEPKK